MNATTLPARFTVARRTRANEPAVVEAATPLAAWYTATGQHVFVGYRAEREGNGWSIYDGPAAVPVGRVREAA